VKKLSASHKKYLRGLAHHLQPIVFLGQKGMTDTFIDSMHEALDRHELVKIKFIDFKEKRQKKEITHDIEETAGCELVGSIGHMAVFYRQHKDPKKRKILLPE
jgi:RNA-binding protein